MTSFQNHDSMKAVDGLPKQFVTSLRILFDILDEERTGYVRLRDIETRWHEEGVKGLPSGVIEALRKVAPRNGRLSFDTFVVGLKQSLLKNNGMPNSASANVKQQVHFERQPQTIPVNAAPAATSSASVPPARQTGKAQISQDDYASKNYANMANYMNIERTVPNGVPVTSGPPVVKNNSASHRGQPKMGTNSHSQVQVVKTATVRPNYVLPSQNLDLRDQIYNREQVQHASVVNMRHKNDYVQPQDNERHQHHNKRHSDDITHYHKYEQSRQAQRPKSAHLETQRPKDSKFQGSPTEIPHGRPELPPPYRRPKEKHEKTSPPPALPPRNMQGRIMRELQNWHQDQKKSPTQQPAGHFHTSSSDSNLPSKGKASGTNIYGVLFFTYV